MDLGEQPTPGGWYPEQRITISEAVSGFTMGAAVASCRSSYMGDISVGKLADLTILDRDIFAIHPNEIPAIGIAGSVVDGEMMYRAW